MSFLYKDESYKIRGAVFDVYNQIGCGFDEEIYHECLEREFALRGVSFESKKPFRLVYKDDKLSKNYVPDFVCYGDIIIEIVSVPEHITSRKSDMLSVLKVLGKRIGFVVNFGLGQKAEILRVVN